MKTLEEQLLLLQENITHTVYHATHKVKFYEMLNDGYFILKHVKDSELEYHPTSIIKYPYYMSTSRSMTGQFIRDYMEEDSVIIEFDGEKLSQNFKGKAVDWYAHKEVERRKFYSETEDRLYSKKSTIPNIEKYIKAAHMCVSPKKDLSRYEKFLVEFKRSFPLYLYTDKKDLLLLRKDRASKL